MKKVFVGLFLACLCCSFAFADLVVMSNKKVTKYPDGTKLNIKAKKSTTVIYNDTVIVIPKGEQISIDTSNKNGIIVSSESGFSGVKIGDKEFNSKKPIKLVVANNGWINVQAGTASVKNNRGDVFIAPEGRGTAVTTKKKSSNEQEPATDTEEAKGAEEAELSDSTDVAEIGKSESKYEQSDKDIAVDTDLSPSAPRN